jgi:hypothetical protein
MTYWYYFVKEYSEYDRSYGKNTLSYNPNMSGMTGTLYLKMSHKRWM